MLNEKRKYTDPTYAALKNEIELIPLLIRIPDNALDMALLHTPKPNDIFGYLNKEETRKEIITIWCIILFLLQQTAYPIVLLNEISLNNTKLIFSEVSKGIVQEI